MLISDWSSGVCASDLSPQAGSEQAQPTLETARDKSGRKDKALTLPPKEKERFTFYEILKNQEVVLPSGAAKSSRPPAVQAPSKIGRASCRESGCQYV